MSQYASKVATISKTVNEEEAFNKQLLETVAEYPVENALDLVKLCEFMSEKSQLARAIGKQFVPQMGFALPFYFSVIGAQAFTENGSRHYKGGSISDVFALDKERKTDWGTALIMQFAKTDSPKLAKAMLRRQLESDGGADGLAATMVILALQQDWIKSRAFRNIDAILAQHINKLGLAQLQIGEIQYASTPYDGEQGHSWDDVPEVDDDSLDNGFTL